MSKIDSEKIYRGIINVSPELIEEAEGPITKKSNVTRIKPGFQKMRGAAVAAVLVAALGITAVAVGPAIWKGLLQFINREDENPQTSSNTSVDPSLLMSFSEPVGGGGFGSDVNAFDKCPYLEINETTELPETLPIYEDEFPTYKSQSQYSFEKLSKEEAEAHMKEYLKIFCENTDQPMPELNVYLPDWIEEYTDGYWCDNVTEQIEVIQYRDFGLNLVFSPQNLVDFGRALKNMDEESLLADPFVKSALSCKNFQNLEFKKKWKGGGERRGYREFRIAEQTDELKWNMLYEHFDSIDLRGNSVHFRFAISILRPLPESPLEEARVIPYETAKEFIENEYSCPVLYCEAAYDRDIVYPGRYIPVYRFSLQGDGYIFDRLVPMTDYPIPQGEEMQQYMNETFGEYATTYDYYVEERHNGTYAGAGEKGKE